MKIHPQNKKNDHNDEGIHTAFKYEYIYLNHVLALGVDGFNTNCIYPANI